MNPLAQDEGLTLEAELRQALQHQRAAIEQARETQVQLERLIARAWKLLDSQCGSAEPDTSRGEEPSRNSASDDRPLRLR